MKKIIIAMILVLFASVSFAEMGPPEPMPPLVDNAATCPEWGWHEGYVNCLVCHDIKPKKIEKGILSIDSNFCWVIDKTIYFDFNNDIDSFLYKRFRDHIYALNKIDYKKVVILIKSFGGGYFDALAIVHVIEELQANGKTVETRVYGNAVSGGFVVMLAGDKRLASKTAILMWHEIISITFLSLEDTSDKEQQAEVMRFLQDNMNQYIADHSKLTKKELDERIRFRDLYVTGEEALKFGFIDGYLK